MKLLQRSEILERLSIEGGEGLFIDPLFDENQIGEVTIDLRLGPDFLVSLLTRKPAIEVLRKDDTGKAVDTYFRTSRRQLGDRFILYPGQLALGTTLEYIALPPDILADVLTRSSYNRLGVHLSTMIQPGFRGCFPIELVNHGNNPVEIVVGSRIVQARLFSFPIDSNYQNNISERKYYGNVRPAISRAQSDADLATLAKL